MKRVSTLRKIHDNILKTQITSTTYQNKKIKKKSQLKKRDKIYLNTKNLKYKKKNRKRNKKLNQIKIESFFIKAIKELVNYELKLSRNVKVFSIFHISLLKSTNSNTFIQDTFHYETQKEKKYKIKSILKKKDTKYLVK